VVREGVLMLIKELAKMIKECNSIVFFGGAGVSTESGVKDYRSADGLYNTISEFGVSPETILSHTFFTQNPQMFYEFYRKYFIIDVEPNAAHRSLAELEKMGKLKAIVTQNIDGLHQKAGSQTVLELHGTAEEFECKYCGKKQEQSEILNLIKNGQVPRCNRCNTVAKPKVVLYEEMLDENTTEKAIEAISGADMLIVGGTSLVVYPAASFVRYFKGKHLVIINKTETDFDQNADLVIRENIGEVFEKVMKMVRV